MVDAIKTTVNRLELTKGRVSDGRQGNSSAPALRLRPRWMTFV